MLSILQKIRPFDATFVVADFQALTEVDLKTVKDSIKPIEYNRFLRGIGKKDATITRSSITVSATRRDEGDSAVFLSPVESDLTAGTTVCNLEFRVLQIIYASYHTR